MSQISPAPAGDAEREADRQEIERRMIALATELVDELRPRSRSPMVTLQSHLERDLAIDSLARIELGLRVERTFGVRLPERALLEAERIGDLVTHTRQSRSQAHAPPLAPIGPLDMGGEVAPPDGAATLLDALEWHAARTPDRVHVTLLVDDERAETLRYGELRDRAQRAAGALARLGVGSGEPVALMLPTSLEFFVCYYGILMAGGVPVPIYPPFRLSQLEDHLRRQASILANCQARVLVSVPEAAIAGRLLRADVASLAHVTTPGALERSGPIEARPGVGRDDIAFIQYTSGSTGDPKGVVLTHAHLLANVRAMGTAGGVSSKDVFVSWLPLYHDMGLIGAWLGSLYYGMHLVLMSPLAFLARPVRWIEAIARHRGTISAAPNFAYELIATRIDAQALRGLDLSSWRWAFNGAEAVSAETLARFAQRLAPLGLDPRSLAPVYGLAECALDLAFPPARRGAIVDHVDRHVLMEGGEARRTRAEDPHALAVVACGHALPGYEIRVVDAAGRPVAERRLGRIEFRGPSATSGYYNNPAATKALFHGDWLDTGDLGYLADRDLFVTGRSKDLIIRAGRNIYPHELEEAVGHLPGIRKGCVAVFGARDPGQATERVIVIAETRETDEARRAELRTAINALAVDLIEGPADAIVLARPGSVLKTSSGKIRRSDTRAWYERGMIRKPRRAVWLQVTRLTLRAGRTRALELLGAVPRLLFAGWLYALFGAAALIGFVATFLPSLRARRAVACALARTLLRLAAFPVRVEGRENLPASACVLVANHASYIDAMVLMATVPKPLAFVAKREFRSNWLMHRLLTATGTHFVERFDAAGSIADVRALIGARSTEECLVFFPEGTFRAAPGLMPFRLGAFAVAAGAGLPVVPVTLGGTRAVLPAHVWLPRFGPIKVAISKAIRPRDSAWSTTIHVRDAARTAILGHLEEPDTG